MSGIGSRTRSRTPVDSEEAQDAPPAKSAKTLRRLHDFLDGLGADTGPHLEGEQGEGDDWGYYDDQGQWVSFGGETNEYLQAAGQAR